MAGQEAYEDLKAAKETEIAAGQDQVTCDFSERAFYYGSESRSG